jgi:membrane protein
VLPNRPVPMRALVVPAALGAVALEVLKVLGGYVVPHYITRSSELYGAIGTVFALLLWLLVFGRLVVYLAVIEAVTGAKPRARTAPA